MAALSAVALAGCGGEGDSAEDPEVKLGAATAPAPEPKPAEPGKPRRVTRPEVQRVLPGARKPPIAAEPIPFDARRVADTAAYTQRHYGERLTRLDPSVIVEHFSVIGTAAGVIGAFTPNEPDTELGELPGLCAHFVVDRDGTILQLVPLSRICRHTVGLNHVAIGIEHVGASDAEVMGNSRQLDASLRLTGWLRCRFAIDTADVIGHAESLSSPYHHERVPELRTQTHEDFQAQTMDRYRTRLARRAC